MNRQLTYSTLLLDRVQDSLLGLLAFRSSQKTDKVIEIDIRQDARVTNHDSSSALNRGLVGSLLGAMASKTQEPMT